MTTMEIDEKAEINEEPKNEDTTTKNISKSLPTIKYENFDLQNYSNRYKGKIKVDRLLHIARVCPDLALSAYEMAIEELKTGIDPSLYDHVAQLAQQAFGADKFKIDTVWMSSQIQNNEKKVRTLEDEIQKWRNLSNRERVCASYLAAAEYYVHIGNYPTAVSRYTEAKSFASDAKMLLDINLKIIIASIKGGLYGHVKSEANNALTSEDIFKDNKFRSKVQASLGLFQLINGRYEQAVELFLDCHFSIHKNYSEILSAHDIALYGGLCALSTFSRQALKQRVLENGEFKKFLELTPQVSKIIRWFYDSEYGRVMAALNDLKKDLIIDMYLVGQADQLLTSIRGKALVQYFSPYSAMDMTKMAAAFNVNVNEMEHELSNCISDNHIQAKIDSHSKIVYASTFNKQRLFFNQLLQSGDEFTRDMKAVLLRMSLQKNGIVVRQGGDEMIDMMNMDEEMADNGILGMGRRLVGFGDSGGQQRGPKQGGGGGGGFHKRRGSKGHN